MMLNIRLYPTNSADVGVVSKQFPIQTKKMCNKTSILWTHVNVLQQACVDTRWGQKEGEKKQVKETTTKPFSAKITWTYILWHPL